MKRYKYEEWDIADGYAGGFIDRLYIDLDGKPITGILEGFYGYTSDPSDDMNCQYVENGRIG